MYKNIECEVTKKAPKRPLGLPLFVQSEGLSLLDSELTAVVATLTAHGVVDVPCSTVGALG